jgi:tetratricopeptide (TPR) repeat protein
MKTRTILTWLVLCFVTGSVLPAQTNPQFAKANQEYAAGDFKAAINDYEDLVRGGQDTANLFYNLGNAYFRKNDFGGAILNYERALALDPRHPEAQANLRIARDEGRALELIPGRSERWLAFANPNQYTITGAAAFWIGILAIAIFVFNRRRSAIAVSILSLSIFALSIGVIYQLRHGKNGMGLAIVTIDNVEARLATADTANRVLTLPAGSEIQVVSHRGDWIYAVLPNDLRGWIPAHSVELVRM